MRAAVTAGWLLSLLLSFASTAVFVQGAIRDTRPGEPRIPLDLSSTSDWRDVPFRVWRDGRFILHLETVNHTPPFGVPYHGTLEVRLEDPSGRRILERAYRGDATGHVRPDNAHWTDLSSLELDGQRGTWRLGARITAADAGFRGARSSVTLRRVREDPGMGGLVNYVMIIPAVALALLAMVAAVFLARRGAGWALWISVAWLLLLVVLLNGRFPSA